jgi:hypothetical protein
VDGDVHAPARAGDAVTPRWMLVGALLVGCAPHVEEDVIAGAAEEVVIPPPVRPVIEEVQLGIVDCRECRPDPQLAAEERALVEAAEEQLASCSRGAAGERWVVMYTTPGQPRGWAGAPIAGGEPARRCAQRELDGLRKKWPEGAGASVEVYREADHQTSAQLHAAIDRFARALAACRRPGISAVAVQVHDADGHLRLAAKHPGDETGEACFIEAMLAFTTPTTWRVEFTISRRAAGGG